jgi:hypothetical protein
VKQRLDQLGKRGESGELISRLANDAQKWTELSSNLRGQIHTARKFAIDHCNRYNGGKGLNVVQETVEGFSEKVTGRIDHLNQTVRDLLQLVGSHVVPSGELSLLKLGRSSRGFQSTKRIDQEASQRA